MSQQKVNDNNPDVERKSFNVKNNDCELTLNFDGKFCNHSF